MKRTIYTVSRVWSVSVLFALMTSCALTTFQTPEVLPPGKAAVGGGVALGLGPDMGSFEGSDLGPGVLPEVDLWGRMAAGRRTDAGIRFTQLWAITQITADVKHQLPINSAKVSMGVGALAMSDLLIGRPPGISFGGFVANFLIGHRSFYGGLRVRVPVTSEHYGSSLSVPLGIVTHGRRWTSMVEAGVHLMNLHYPMISLGLGFQYIL